jgi:hypothetical protein
MIKLSNLKNRTMNKIVKISLFLILGFGLTMITMSILSEFEILPLYAGAFRQHLAYDGHFRLMFHLQNTLPIFVIITSHIFYLAFGCKKIRIYFE